MKSVASALLGCACFGLILANSPKAESEDPAIDAIKQIEQDMGKAMVAGDIDKLDQIYADDFATVGSSGEVVKSRPF